MAQSGKLSDDIVALVRREAEQQGRSVAGQVTHWLKIGRAIERTGRFDHARVAVAREGQVDTTLLSADEEAAWLDAFAEKMGQPTEAEESFFSRRRAHGHGVGLDADGNLTHARDDTSP